MPTYEYECDKCGHRFERVQKFSDRPVRRCESCRGPVHKVFYPVGIIFKGSGWHSTDYDSNGPKSRSKPTTTTETGGDGKPKKAKQDVASD